MPEVFKKSGDVVPRRIAGESLLIPIRGKAADLQRIFALSDVAEFIWERLDGHRRLDDLVREIAGSFDVDPARARADATEFVETLRAEGLIELAEEPPCWTKTC